MTTPTLSVAVEGFILDKKIVGRSENTLNDYQITLNRFTEYLGNPHIDTITSEQIKNFFYWLRYKYQYDPGNIGDPKKFRHLGDKTLVNNYSTIMHFWQWALSAYRLKENPFNVPKMKFNKPPIIPFTMEEIKDMLNVCKKTSVAATNTKRQYRMKRPTYLRDRAIILTLLDTGLRVSELCNLRFRGIDLRNSRIRTTGKGQKERDVYIGKNATKALWDYKSERFPDGDEHPDDFVFVDQENLHQLTRNAVRMLLKRIGERADVKDVYPHRFRHTFAVQFLMNGGNPYTLQDLLGHTSMDMTKRYVHLAQMDAQTIFKRASPADGLLR
jgi:integrase/recombinase XerD